MYPIIQKLHALNGDTWSTPASTLSAFWAALGAGADTLCLTVYLTKDNVVVCIPADNLLASCGVDIAVKDITLNELQTYDAGATFRSTVLDEHYQPTGKRGEDTPWHAKPKDDPLKARRHVYHPSLKEVFEVFSRRVDIQLQLPQSNDSTLTALLTCLVDTVKQWGLETRVTFAGSLTTIQRVHALFPEAKLCVECHDAISTADIHALSQLQVKRITTRYELIKALPSSDRESLFLYANQHHIRWYFSSEVMPFAPSEDALNTIRSYANDTNCQIEAWQSKGVLPCRSACAAWPHVFAEPFKGKTLNAQYWAAGYSHINQETRIHVDDKLIITIAEGKAYSGGAAICLLAIHGDFDAEVSFHVANPHQATTFELAAMVIDPGYHHIDNHDLDSRKVNLTFDVHGAPPYASSERDQNDAFRCGWNNSFNFAKFGGQHKNEWEASSSNMYNKYGRGVGDGSLSNPNGKLRLIRQGDIFTSYYKDAHNTEWVCSGTMLVQSLPQTAYLRLAAKHWHKIDPAPGNVVSFWDFTYRQPI